MPIVGLDYVLLCQSWLFKYRGLVIGLGQGMTYHRETGQVEYQSKDEKETRVFATYDEQAGSSAVNYIIDPDYPAEAYFYEVTP